MNKATRVGYHADLWPAACEAQGWDYRDQEKRRDNCLLCMELVRGPVVTSSHATFGTDEVTALFTYLRHRRSNPPQSSQSAPLENASTHPSTRSQTRRQTRARTGSKPLPLLMEIQTRIIYRALVWAEQITTETDGKEITNLEIERSRETLLLAAYDPQKLQQRVATTIPRLAKNGELI